MTTGVRAPRAQVLFTKSKGGKCLYSYILYIVLFGKSLLWQKMFCNFVTVFQVTESQKSQKRVCTLHEVQIISWSHLHRDTNPNPKENVYSSSFFSLTPAPKKKNNSRSEGGHLSQDSSGFNKSSDNANSNSSALTITAC